MSERFLDTSKLGLPPIQRGVLRGPNSRLSDLCGLCGSAVSPLRTLPRVDATATHLPPERRHAAQWISRKSALPGREEIRARSLRLARSSS